MDNYYFFQSVKKHIFENKIGIKNAISFSQKSHGKPQELSSRHVGDLGNIESPDEDITEVKLLDKLITLDKNEINDITGRAFVVHAGEDDLGMGGKKIYVLCFCNFSFSIPTISNVMKSFCLNFYR